MDPTFLGLTGDDWAAVGYSVVVAGAAVAVALPFGVALGWLLARRTFPGKFLLETALNLPLVMPPIVTGYLLLIAFGRRSWFHETFKVSLAFTSVAAVLAGAVMGFPLLVRSVRLAFQGVDPRLYQAARSLGAKPLDAFWSVSLPLARNGVIAGAVLAFARGLGEFGATLLFAGSQPGRRTLALQIYVLYERSGDVEQERMWRLVAASIVLACAALFASEWLERRGARRESA
jgi:molybdate transport system permease protein